MDFPKRFFECIFRNVLEDYELDVEFRCLHPSSDKDSLRPKQFWVQSLEEMKHVWPDIEELNEHGYHVHLTVLPRLRKAQGKKEHPVPDEPIVSCVWADLDVGKDKPYGTIAEALRCVQKLEPLPNIIVESGTGIHVYYLLDRPKEISAKRLDALLRSLTKLLGGDRAAARAGRLMRVPGTVNWKREAKRRQATVTYLSKVGHRFKDLEIAWKVKASAGNSGKDWSGKRDDQALAQQPDYFALFSPHVEKLARRGEQAIGLCPFHDDHDPSFSLNVRTGQWICFACGRDGNWLTFRL